MREVDTHKNGDLPYEDDEYQIAWCSDSNILDVEYMGLCQRRDHFELGGREELHEELP